MINITAIPTSAHPVVMTADDFMQLQSVVSDPAAGAGQFLASELARAIIVKSYAIPKHTIRIGSRVTLRDLNTDHETSVTVVMPADADVSQNRISILTSLAAAIIGFRTGEDVVFDSPHGATHLLIVDVQNTPLQSQAA